MYLKSIEVQGFKSFANKLTFEFQEGITGIVGPNGSGKSNVADAVRWVLGEQSAKQLRGGQMQDVIFAGTETRKAQGFASVAITFDNSDHVLDVDYEEVTVTRRLYRSGESEYIINGSQVRLKDIQEIFYDTGIGQEGYSIIGQGQIDRILSGKAEERRELFDEAAGIVKFKKRKREALRKLDHEHQNLLRVNDILEELTSRVGPLKKQSEAARIYLDRKEELKKQEIALFVIEETRTEHLLNELCQKLEAAETELGEAGEAYEETRKEYEEIEKQLEELEEGIGALQDSSSKEAVIRQQLIGQIELLNEQIRAVEVKKEQQLKRKEQIASDIERNNAEIQSRNAENEAEAENEEQVIAEEEKEAAALKALDEQISETVHAIDLAKNKVIRVLNDRAQVRGKGQRYDTMLEQMEIRRSEISARLLKLKDEEDTYAEEARKNREEADALSKEIDRLGEEEASTDETLTLLRTEMGEIHQRLDEATTSYHRDSSRLESLKAMAEHYDGYGNGIRRIMEQKKRNPGIKGVVADLIDSPAEYELAIETALGGSIRNIVTDNEATAKYLIEYLKTNRFGRATFLPLTSIKGRPFTKPEALSEPGVIGIAADLVETEEEYSELKSYLLGRILVVDHIDHAIAIGRKYRHSIYMVTLQGESFSPGGSITGGAFKNTDNLLGRKREIEELEHSTVSLRKETEKLRESIENKKQERNRLREEVSQKGEEIQHLRIRMNTVEMNRRQADEQLQLLQIDANALMREADEIRMQIEDVTRRNSSNEQTLAESMDLEQEVNEEAENLKKQEAELRKKRDEQAKLLEEIHLRSLSISEKRNFRNENLKRMHRELKALQEELELLDQEIDEGLKEKESKEQQIREVELTVDAATKKAEEDEAKKAGLIEEKNRLSADHKEFFEKRDELMQRMNLLDKEVYRLGSQKEKASEGREERSAYMWEEYSLTPSEVRALSPDVKDEDRGQIRKQISGLKSEIKGLGNINVNAIEEYKEVSERYEFLTAQHEDLIRSEDTLTGIITELDEGMRRQFSEKFAEIRTEFDQAFQELFGGGHGTIDIDPNADILDASISIIAHPPGKKLQNMMQLSGGEKALTAIALLFAIQNLKPSPFCLLDEIEAALDESNVGHFAEYLHKLTKNTQFIIITHRRGTMTSCDRLYGITMQEKGVSALVSVNLIEDKLSK